MPGEYRNLFAVAGSPVNTPFEPGWSRAVYHLYVVRADDRDGMMSALKDRGIGTGIHYPIPLHLRRRLTSISAIAKAISQSANNWPKRSFSLSMFPQLKPEQQQRVVKAPLLSSSRSPAPFNAEMEARTTNVSEHFEVIIGRISSAGPTEGVEEQDQRADFHPSVSKDGKLGRDVKLSKFIILYGCGIGEETKIGAFVEGQQVTAGLLASHEF